MEERDWEEAWIWHICRANRSVIVHSQETSSQSTICARSLSIPPRFSTKECVISWFSRATESLLHAPLKFCYCSLKIYSLYTARLSGTDFLQQEALSAVLFLQAGVGKIKLFFIITSLSYKLQNYHLRVLGNGKTHMIPPEMQKLLKRLWVTVCGGGVFMGDSYLRLVLMSRETYIV